MNIWIIYDCNSLAVMLFLISALVLAFRVQINVAVDARHFKFEALREVQRTWFAVWRQQKETIDLPVVWVFLRLRPPYSWAKCFSLCEVSDVTLRKLLLISWTEVCESVCVCHQRDGVQVWMTIWLHPPATGATSREFVFPGKVPLAKFLRYFFTFYKKSVFYHLFILTNLLIYF